MSVAPVTNTFNDAHFHYVEELLDSRSGTPFQSGGSRNYTRKWRVKLRDRTVGSNIICRAPNVPPYSPYVTEDGKEFDLQALCVGLELEEPEDKLDGTHRIVVARYSTEMPQGGPARNTNLGFASFGPQAQPWLEPPHIEWDGEVYRDAPEADLNGKRYLNSARVPFRPAPTFEDARAVMIYERNEASHDVNKQRKYSFAVNSDVFLGQDPGTVQLYPPRAILQWRGGTSFWRVTYRFRFSSQEAPRPTNRQYRAADGQEIPAGVARELAPPPREARARYRSWQPRILDAGLMQLQNIWPLGPAFGLPIPIMRGNGAVTEPVPLDGTGRELKPDPATGTFEPVYLEFKKFPTMPFSPLLVSGIGFPG